MHPQTQFTLASDQLRRDRARADRRRSVPRRARPPSRWRFVVAVVLAHAAARVTREPVVILPRRV